MCQLFKYNNKNIYIYYTIYMTPTNQPHSFGSISIIKLVLVLLF